MIYFRASYTEVKHYLIQQNSYGQYYVRQQDLFSSIEDLINAHRQDRGHLASRLKYVPKTNANLVIDIRNLHITTGK